MLRPICFTIRIRLYPGVPFAPARNRPAFAPRRSIRRRSGNVNSIRDENRSSTCERAEQYICKFDTNTARICFKCQISRGARDTNAFTHTHTHTRTRPQMQTSRRLAGRSCLFLFFFVCSCPIYLAAATYLPQVRRGVSFFPI